MSEIIINGMEDFQNNVIKSDIPVLADFWATWCGPCKMIAPHIAKIAEENSGKIKGYLAYHNGISIGWCNANDRLNYYRVGEFNMDDIPEDKPPLDCPDKGYVKSIVCFEISPDYRGMGIAGRILERICKDAAEEGYAFVEAYPMDHVNDNSLAFTGPLRLYEKFGFREYKRIGSTIVVRKDLRQL